MKKKTLQYISRSIDILYTIEFLCSMRMVHGFRYNIIRRPSFNSVLAYLEKYILCILHLVFKHQLTNPYMSGPFHLYAIEILTILQ